MFSMRPAAPRCARSESLLASSRERDAVSAEADFLISLGQVLSAAGLYGDRHPAFRSAVDGALSSLLALLQTDANPRYSFLDEEIIFANRRLRELRDWQWARELVECGAERMEFTQGVDGQEFDRFLSSLLRSLDRTAGHEETTPRLELPHIRVGAIAVEEVERLRRIDETEELLARPEMDEEAQAVDHLFAHAEARGLISLAVARAVIQSLSAVIRYGKPLMELLIPVRNHDEYTTVHSLNVSVLSMSLAEAAGVPRDDIRDIGEAALLHDVGKALTPIDILQKPGKLTPDEWEIIKKHPKEGATIILRSGEGTDFAAVVAYEHHLTWQGGGYPRLRYPRRPHPVSQLVQICDIFDALRTERPFRGPWSVSRILGYFDELSGTDLNPDVLAVFRAMMDGQSLEPVPDEEGPEPELARAGAPAGADEQPAGRSDEAADRDRDDAKDSGNSADV
jgi:putative nucleotidyltransferase with HDIG domain